MTRWNSQGVVVLLIARLEGNLVLARANGAALELMRTATECHGATKRPPET